MKSLGVYYWYIKMAQCGYVEHGLEYFPFYVQKHIAHLAACSGPPAGSRRATRGAHISETRLLHLRASNDFPCKPEQNRADVMGQISSVHYKKESKVLLLFSCITLSYHRDRAKLRNTED